MSSSLEAAGAAGRESTWTRDSKGMTSGFPSGLTGVPLRNPVRSATTRSGRPLGASGSGMIVLSLATQAE